MGLPVAVAVVRTVTAAALAVVAVALQAAVQPTSGGILAVWVAAIWVAALGRPGPKAVTMAPAWLAGLSGPLAVLLIPTVIGRRVANQTTTAIALTIATTIPSGIFFVRALRGLRLSVRLQPSADQLARLQQQLRCALRRMAQLRLGSFLPSTSNCCLPPIRFPLDRRQHLAKAQPFSGQHGGKPGVRPASLHQLSFKRF